MIAKIQWTSENSKICGKYLYRCIHIFLLLEANMKIPETTMCMLFIFSLIKFSEINECCTKMLRDAYMYEDLFPVFLVHNIHHF